MMEHVGAEDPYIGSSCITYLLAVMLLMQAETAEETFKKIGDGIQQAKSVRVECQWTGATKTDAAGKVEASGTVLLKDLNRVNLTGLITEKGQPSELRIVSDGTTVKTRLGAR